MASEYHIEIKESLCALDVLAEECNLSRTLIKQAMQKGAAWYTRGKHTQHLRRAKKLLQPGDTLHLYYDEKVINETVADAELIADEGDYSVWYKPYGMRSQGSRWGDHTTVHRWAESHLQPQRNAFLVHRLDRAASGLILIAHSKKMAATLSAMFKQRQIDKRYKVIVHGQPPQAV
ncbi:MAG: RNA pseudouridine synthase, partial [Gammaproteobacteria bacterium]|nr:RNA pseudouridine synthase [Gammaproteobacteria bacterium]